MLGSVETIVAEPSRRRRRYDRQLENIQFWRSIDHFFLRLLRPFWGALVFFFVFVALAVGGCGGFLGASDPGGHPVRDILGAESAESLCLRRWASDSSSRHNF